MHTPLEPIENNFKSYFLWGIGFVIAQLFLSLLGVLLPWQGIKPLILLLSYASEFGAFVCFVIGGWKVILIWRSASQKAQQKTSAASQNESST